jgi:hypothetical protein
MKHRIQIPGFDIPRKEPFAAPAQRIRRSAGVDPVRLLWYLQTVPRRPGYRNSRRPNAMENLKSFSARDLSEVNNAVAMAEELVSNHFKMSASQWLRPRFDIKTLAELNSGEIVHGPFAQIIRYVGRRPSSSLGSSAYDFYKICLQDHAIFDALSRHPDLSLFPFLLYIVTHELIHIVRFSKFLQNFEASREEKLVEEARVHQITHEILTSVSVSGLAPVLKFYEKWRQPVDGFEG